MWQLTKDPSLIDAWGYKFRWTNLHQDEAALRPLKYTFDEQADEVVSRLNARRDALAKEASLEETARSTTEANDPSVELLRKKKDLYELLQELGESDEDEVVARFWKDINTVPDWVDWEQIGRGQDVFYRYIGAALVGLAYSSLLGGMGAARVVETLSRTGGFSPRVARHRMFETTQHILQVTTSVDSIKPGGAGFISSIRVRFLHSSVRQRIMALAKTKPEYYDVGEFGVPINDLDSIGTILTFSCNLIYMSFPRQGIYLREQEIVDYLALWRLVAFYFGCPTDPFANVTLGKAWMESILLREVNPSETSKILAGNIITALSNSPPYFASPDFLRAQARWLNGNQLSDALGLAYPSFMSRSLMFAQCVLFGFYTYLYRSIPALDRRKGRMMRKTMYDLIVTGKHGIGTESKFEMKYVPEFGLGDDGRGGGRKNGNFEVMPRKEDRVGLIVMGSDRWLERRNLTVLAMFFCALLTTGWVSTKLFQLGRGIVGRLI